MPPATPASEAPISPETFPRTAEGDSGEARFSRRRILVTGAKGFVGSWLLRALHHQEARLTCLVRPGHSGKESGSLEGGRPLTPEHTDELLAWYEVDLHDADAVTQVVEQTQPEFVFHLAARTAHSARLDHLEDYWHDNVEVTRNLLSACQALRGKLQRFVSLGSAEEYGPQEVSPLHEGLALRPTSPYGISKATATMLCQAWWKQEGVATTVLRPFLLYGSGQASRFFLTQALAAIHSGPPLRMSRGEQTRDFLHVEDAVAGLLAAALAPSLKGEVVNLCTGREHSLQDICTLLEDLSGQHGCFVRGALPYRSNEIFRMVGCNQRLCSETGWQPQHVLEKDLRQLLGEESPHGHP